MKPPAVYTFAANLDLIGINPFVHLPPRILNKIFKDAEKRSSPIRIRGTINQKAFEQTLVKYKGQWRLYVNTRMLKEAPKRIGEKIEFSIGYNTEEKTRSLHPGFTFALQKHKKASSVFRTLSPSLQNEITGYLARLKSAEAVERNIKRAIDFLTGKGRFIGRDPICQNHKSDK